LKRVMTIVCAGALTSVALIGATSAGAGTGDDHSLSVQARQCEAMKRADRAAFKATFGDHAMRRCIKGEPVDPTVPEFKNAAKECKAEREADAEAFQTTWGSNNNGRNALGKCVSSHVKHADDEGDDEGDDTGEVVS
jgi:hypothetical protein